MVVEAAAVAGTIQVVAVSKIEFVLTNAGKIDPHPEFRAQFNDEMLNAAKAGVSWATGILRVRLPNCSFTVTGSNEEIILRFNHPITSVEKAILVDLFKKLCKTRKEEILETKTTLLRELQTEMKKKEPAKKSGLLTRFREWLI